MTKLEKALSNLPKLLQLSYDKKKDFIEFEAQPLVKLSNSNFSSNCLAYITNEDGEINDSAFSYNNLEIDYVCEKLIAWAKKYGYVWECEWSGTFGLYKD